MGVHPFLNPLHNPEEIIDALEGVEKGWYYVVIM